MGTHAYSTNSLMGPKEKSYTKEIKVTPTLRSTLVFFIYLNYFMILSYMKKHKPISLEKCPINI
jgi:hypothetical protein